MPGEEGFEHDSAAADGDAEPVGEPDPDVVIPWLGPFSCIDPRPDCVNERLVQPRSAFPVARRGFALLRRVLIVPPVCPPLVVRARVVFSISNGCAVQDRLAFPTSTPLATTIWRGRRCISGASGRLRWRPTLKLLACAAGLLGVAGVACREPQGACGGGRHGDGAWCQPGHWDCNHTVDNNQASLHAEALAEACGTRQK
jgi:hypothetical protein